MGTIRCEQIGVGISKDQFVEFLNGVQGGQFFHISGYVNSHGEKADHFLRFGIKYGSLKDRDVAFLRQVVSGGRQVSVEVTHGVWIPTDRLNGVVGFTGEHAVHAKVKYDAIVGGASVKVEKVGSVNLLDTDMFTNRKSKDKVPATITYVLPCDHPLIAAAIGGEDLGGTILQGLLHPREASVEYDKEAKSAYSLDKDGTCRWYLRDVLRVSKVVRVEGDYPFSASLPINAVKEAISRNFLLTGKYGQFILTDGQFEAITIAGQSILVDGIDEEFFLALPEDVKAEVEREVETVMVT